MSHLYTLVEYYSVSNDSINRRMMIADAVPGKLDTIYFYHIKF